MMQRRDHCCRFCSQELSNVGGVAGVSLLTQKLQTNPPAARGSAGSRSSRTDIKCYQQLELICLGSVSCSVSFGRPTGKVGLTAVSVAMGGAISRAANAAVGLFNAENEQGQGKNKVIIDVMLAT
jgi:hypothetical protein